VKDPRYRDRSPQGAEEQDAPRPERPVPEEERRRGEGQDEHPSQAEGERDGSAER
jgi:hypothetical protein